MARARQIALVLGLALETLGCDIVQGFQHAGDALFPPVETYLDVPGYRMTTGHFRYLDMITSSEPYILARSATDGDDALFVMHFNAPTPCAIPNAARYWTGAGADTKRTYVAFFDASDSGILHFSDLDCTPLDFTLEHANLPIDHSPTGLVLQVGPDLFDVNPAAGTTKLLASSLEAFDAQHHLVRAGGRIGVFDSDWALVRWVGDGVVDWASAFGTTFFEDKGGIQRLTITDANGTRTASTLTLDSSACDLTILPQTPHLQLVGYHAPCAETTATVWDAQTHQASALPFATNLDHLKLFGSSTDSHPDFKTDTYFALYLADLDASGDTGTLHLRTLDGTDLVVGGGAALERAELARNANDSDYSGGFALLDVDGPTGRFVRFDFDGNVSDIATGVVRRPAEPSWTRLVIAVNDAVNDLAEVVNGQAVTVAHDVPNNRYAYSNRFEDNPLSGRLAWFQDLHGDLGTLSLASPDPSSGMIDDQGHEPLYRATPVAHDVYMNGHGFMVDLPGFAYFAAWDAKNGTGRLDYSNEELRFSATVSEGVSDYLQPGSGLLYTVPFGSAAGIWLARGK
ncbi:MAG TPA: hypothetical protein VLJ38_21870 [Polyangiaceae bacterium]|nr:hypothetical protein [Polyangiaceae bacterium]